jgi:serine phosphatase RsbU (regulator of sigma subunit)
MAAALEHLAVGVAVIKLPDLVFEYVNPAFQAFAPDKEMIGLRNDDVFPEMGFLAKEVLHSLKHVGQSWRAENVANRIRRSPDGPLEEVLGTIEITRIEIHGGPQLLVTAVETTETSRIAMEYERLHEEEAHRLAFAETMDRVSAVIHSSLDWDEIMQRSLEEATKALGARAGAVFVGLNGNSVAKYVVGFPKGMLGRSFSAETFPLAKLMLDRMAPVPVEAEDMNTLMSPLLARTFKVRSLLAIPLVLGGQLAGGIGLVYGKPHKFTPSELTFAASFGASVSLALENAELYRHQERVADTLQEALLVLPDSVPGVTFAHAYSSASESVKVGGDFYDCFMLDDDKLFFVVADVSGKGLASSLFMALSKALLKSIALRRGDDPAWMLARASKEINRDNRESLFVTALAGVLDAKTGRLVVCNAGHEPAVVCRADGTPERSSDPGGPPLCVIREYTYESVEHTLGPGEWFCVITDGVTEAMNEQGKLYGSARVLETLSAMQSAAPDAVIGALVDDVRRFAGSAEKSDDMTLLCVRWDGATGSPPSRG